MLTKNIILSTDGYKVSHFRQYPEGSQFVSSYIEARKFDKELFTYEPEVVNFGLQAFIKEYLLTPITRETIDHAKRVLVSTGYVNLFNEEGWEIILKDHGGYLPIEIQALPEGMPFAVSIPQIQIRNLDDRLPWLTSYVETALLRAIWYPSTVATISREIKKSAMVHLNETCENPEAQIGFRLNDFGARGASSYESAAVGGMAHLVNFLGTDTICAVDAVLTYYGCEEFIGATINASEHSTITSWGRDGEEAAYRNMIKQFGGEGALFACVSDSYDIFKAVREYWGGSLKDEVIGSGGVLIVRPDSGNPLEVLRSVLNILEETYGATKNSKGFKVLHPSVRIIQGDGINPFSIRQIMRVLAYEGWSAENIAFGMGGALLQKLDRDTLGYAMKANEIEGVGFKRDVYKDPVTDKGKVSKKGRQAVIRENGKLVSIREDELNGRENLLIPTFRTGKLLVEYTFEEVRKNAAI